MPIPDLNTDGFLPPGVHDCTIDELDDRFCQFQQSDRRLRLCEKFKEFLTEIRSTGLVACIVADGSFVTSKPEPEDIDLILVIPADHDYSAELRPFEYNVLSKRRVRRRYGFDVLVAREGSDEYDEYVEFFQQIRGLPGRRKGLVKVLP
jgi:hypothetical protein